MSSEALPGEGETMSIRRIVAVLAAVIVVAAGIVVAAPRVGEVEAAPQGVFDPSYIISDAEFFDSSAMNEAQIQQFLERTACSPRDGVPCLRSYTQSTPNRAAAGTQQCGAYQGGASESAARIIAKVSQACGISPQALLVLMQKEQSLITNPSSWGYAHATGANCPDTPEGCDPAYSGFFVQVYGAAWQFRQYAKYPNSFNHRVGNSYVRYSPTASCGGTTVNIRNQATVNLYNYTPYQPNAAALANLYGTGDACSTYGNRNFWRIYYDWFGSPTESSPIGAVENAQPVPGGVGIWGWAVDTDTRDPLAIHVYVDGRMAIGATADASWPGVNQRFGLGDRHGFAITVPADPGPHSICVFAINVGPGSNTQITCFSASGGGGDPIGAVENVQAQPDGIGVWGFALDRDTPDPIWVHIYVDGKFSAGVLANESRPDIGSRYPYFGERHGFSATLAASPGRHRVCAYGINVGTGSRNTELGCVDATAGGNPTGAVVGISSGLKTISVDGWAIDPDTRAPIWLHVYVDGRFAAGVYADRQRRDLGIFQSFGDNHGYAVDLPAENGARRVCVYALNVASGDTNTEIGCRTVDVGGPPVGVVENGQPGFASIGVWGWVYDPDTASPIGVHVYVDGKFAGSGSASTLRPDATSIPPAYGDNHGYGVTVPASPGQHRVCVYGLNTGYGAVNTEIGCFTTTVSGSPVGAVENIQTVGDGLGVWGYAIDPDTTEPIDVHVYIDGVFAAGLRADQSRTDVAERFPGFGSAHAFGGVVPASRGMHEVCAFAINVPSGTNPVIGCVKVERR